MAPGSRKHWDPDLNASTAWEDYLPGEAQLAIGSAARVEAFFSNWILGPQPSRAFKVLQP